MYESIINILITYHLSLITAAVPTRLPIVPIVTPELVHASDDNIFVHVGFPEHIKDFHDVTEPTHREYLPPLRGEADGPPAKVHFTLGEDVSLVWQWETDTIHNFKSVQRKVMPTFEREDLLPCEDEGDELPIHRESTVGHVHTELTISPISGHTHSYHYTLNVTLHEPTEEDAGFYINSEKPSGFQSLVELLPTGTACVFPATPVFHMDKITGRHTLIVYCQAEGQGLDNIELYHDDELLTSTNIQTVVKGQSLSNARIIAFQTNPDAERPWNSYNGDYKCVVTTRDGDHYEHEEHYEFVVNPSPSFSLEEEC